MYDTRVLRVFRGHRDSQLGDVVRFVKFGSQVPSPEAAALWPAWGAGGAGPGAGGGGGGRHDIVGPLGGRGLYAEQCSWPWVVLDVG